MVTYKNDPKVKAKIHILSLKPNSPHVNFSILINLQSDSFEFKNDIRILRYNVYRQYKQNCEKLAKISSRLAELTHAVNHNFMQLCCGRVMLKHNLFASR